MSGCCAALFQLLLCVHLIYVCTWIYMYIYVCWCVWMSGWPTWCVWVSGWPTIWCAWVTTHAHLQYIRMCMYSGVCGSVWIHVYVGRGVVEKLLFPRCYFALACVTYQHMYLHAHIHTQTHWKIYIYVYIYTHIYTRTYILEKVSPSATALASARSCCIRTQTHKRTDT